MVANVFFLLAAVASVAATARYSKFDVKRDSVTAKTVDGTVVGAKVINIFIYQIIQKFI